MSSRSPITPITPASRGFARLPISSFEQETRDREDLEWPAPHFDRMISYQQFDDSKVAGKLFEAGRDQLFYTVPSSADSAKPRAAVLNLSTLNRMLSHSLQHKLAGIVARLFDDPTCLLSNDVVQELGSYLREYCWTIRNAELMQQHISDGTIEDPFKVKSNFEIDRDILEHAGLIPTHMTMHGPLPYCDDAGRPDLLGSSRHAAIDRSKKRRRIENLLHSLGGAMALMVPMFVMIYVPGQISSVITTCTAILVFALAVAWKSDLGPGVSLTATAAYSAVLIAFVGRAFFAIQQKEGHW